MLHLRGMCVAGEKGNNRRNLIIWKTVIVVPPIGYNTFKHFSFSFFPIFFSDSFHLFMKLKLFFYKHRYRSEWKFPISLSPKLKNTFRKQYFLHCWISRFSDIKIVIVIAKKCSRRKKNKRGKKCNKRVKNFRYHLITKEVKSCDLIWFQFTREYETFLSVDDVIITTNSAAH